MSGRISLLVSRDMRVLVEAARSLPDEVRKQLRVHTKAQAAPLWKSALAHQSATRLQNRVLVDSGRVSVSDQNVMLKSAQVGKLSSGTPVSVLAGPAEFGVSPSKIIQQRSRGGKKYSRRIGLAFAGNRRAGHVFTPALRESIARVASLWFQTAVRTTAEQFKKAGA